MKKLITVQKNNYSWKELPAEELRNYTISLSAEFCSKIYISFYWCLSASKNQSQISIQSKDIED